MRRKKRLKLNYFGPVALICLLLVLAATTYVFFPSKTARETVQNVNSEAEAIEQLSLEELRLASPDQDLGRKRNYAYFGKDLARDIESGWKLILVVNKSVNPGVGQTLAVYLDGKPYRVWPVSTALEGVKVRPNGTRMFATTFTGRFTVEDMYTDYFSNAWQEQLKNMIFYGPREYGIAFHSAPDRKTDRKIGKRDSAGCIRLHEKNSAELFSLVRAHKHSTLVIVHEASGTDPDSIPRKTDLSML